MATLGSLFGGVWLSTRGGDKKKQQGPPINASSKDEEQFIQYVCRCFKIGVNQFDDANDCSRYLQGVLEEHRGGGEEG